ncbi:MAG: phenylacetate-CoA oxygenase subunit PaaI [Bacteroidota bacterium]|jgi:ring-1,2-phenylacetyl-CoA epoxidase subunit PaaC
MEAQKKYYLQIADNALILSHRLSEYSSNGPFLEEDLANTNVALDLIGIAESILEETARIDGKGLTGDDLAYRRGEHEFYNSQLVEQPNTDFAFIMVRQFLTDAFHFYFYSDLTKSKDEFLSAIAYKSLKEITYHLRRSSEWLIRLGDGTQLANDKTQHAVNTLWKYTNEFFTENEVDLQMRQSGKGVDLNEVRNHWMQKINEIFFMAHLKIPSNDFQLAGGKEGKHTEHMGYILAEMQFLPSKYPDAKW